MATLLTCVELTKTELNLQIWVCEPVLYFFIIATQMVGASISVVLLETNKVNQMEIVEVNKKAAKLQYGSDNN